MMDNPEARARLRRKLEIWPEGRHSPVSINTGLELLDIIDSLEKEADWLATYIGKHECQKGTPPTTICPGDVACKNCWREAARKAVKEQNNG